MNFYVFLGFVILQRLSELIVARRNETWSRSQGGIEYGRAHYPFMILLHTAFIISIPIEYLIRGGEFQWVLFFLFLVCIALKIWVIASLGKYWNTKIIRIPHTKLVANGPYKYFKHPNYFIVVCEIILIPLVFQLWFTAIIFSLLNVWMLKVRIRAEEKALNMNPQ